MINASRFPLLDHMASGILAIKMDGTIVLWNKPLEQWSGTNSAHIIGKNLFEQFPELNDDKIRHRIEQVYHSCTPVIFSPEPDRYLIRWPLGNGKFRTHRVTITWLQDDQLALFCIEDQSEQSRLIENYQGALEELQSELDRRIQLEKRNDRLIAAIDQAGEAVIITSRDGRIEYCNKALLHQTGREMSEINSIGSYDGLLAEPDHNFRMHIEHAFKADKAWVGQREIRRKDGSSFTASTSIAPILNADGHVTHSIIIQEDISPQLAIEEKLRTTQKQEALITLVGGIAHDFNNLLAGLVGQVYLAAREVKDMPKTAERLKKVQGIAHEAAEIVKQLLTFARQGEHLAKEFPLDSFFKEFYKLASHSVPESIKFSLDFDQNRYPFRGDANQLQQALLNIVQNAVTACEEISDGEIKLGLSAFNSQANPALITRHPVLRHENFAHITICDNGCGIPAASLEKIFDPFFSTRQLGSGMGLAMVIGCIRHHHGIIDVVSSPGQGTTFHILFPTIGRKAAPDNIPQHSKNICANILLVDDDPRVLEPTQELLEAMGHHVTLANDGMAACRVFEQELDNWDIVITDMVMPRMNGLEASKKMRLIRPDIPVIYATGYDQSLVIDKTREMGNSMLISKPFNPDDLDRLIVDMVGRKGRIAKCE